MVTVYFAIGDEYYSFVMNQYDSWTRIIEDEYLNTGQTYYLLGIGEA